MSLVSVFSAKGAPGATTAAMLTASLWPRPVLLADCDPAGGDIGLRLPAPDGRPLDLGRGVLSLLPVARRALDPSALAEHTQQMLGGGEVLVGMTGPEQAAAVGPVWSTIADALAGLPDRDVIVDIGRLDSRSPVVSLALAAQVAICVMDASLAGVFSSRARLRTLLPALQNADGSGPRVGIVVRGPDKRDAQDAGNVVQGEFPSVAYFGYLPEDRAGAGIFAGRPVSRPERTLLVRAGRDMVGAVQGELSKLQIRHVPAAEQPWNSLTGAYAAYAPYLVPAGDAPAAEPAPAEPKRSRSEERRLARKKNK